MKKLLVLLLVATLGLVLYRRYFASEVDPGSRHAHQHGTPDHWPSIVRKPGTKTASAA